MKKHRLLFLWLSLLLCAVGARADFYTLNDGTTTNEYVPVYGYYVDDLTASQFIIPAGDLPVGGTISSMTFYANSSVAWGSPEFEVYLSEVDEQNFSSAAIYPWDSMTKVYEGVIIVNDKGEMSITFDNSYTYNGGNLLVAFKQTLEGSYKHSYWYGVESTGGTVTGYNSSSIDDIINYTVRNFLPKVTFECSGGVLPIPRPTDLTVQLTPGDGSRATLSWTENGTATQWEICLLEDEDNLFTATTNPFELFPITPETTYTAKVRAVVGDEHSNWSNTVTFTPTNAFNITVNEEGTSTNQYVPIYGYYADGISKSQFVIPAADLVDMQYGIINKMTFYASNASVDWGSAKFEVYVSEVENTTLESLVDWSSMEKVMNAGTLSVSGNTMEVTLDKPYQYMGGNLMIGFLETSSGSWKSVYWLGVTQTENTALGGHDSDVYAQQFLPKTTFSYMPGEAPACPKPTNLSVEPMHNQATISWTGTSESYNVRYRTPEEAVSSFSEDFEDGLNQWTTIVNAEGSGWRIANPANFTGNYSAHSGNYVIMTRSYENGEDITADNWLISKQIDLGGTLKFWVMGDSNYPESYSVLVSTLGTEPDDFDNLITFTTNPDSWEEVSIDLGAYKGKTGYIAFHHEDAAKDLLWIDDISIVTDEVIPAGEWQTISTEETSVEITDLTANTEYEYQVQGVCGGEPGEWTNIRSFTTLAEDIKVFVTDGNWDVADNWLPTGAPTEEEDVIIRANAIIPSGVLATAKTAAIDGGSITIKDGGQLMQGSSDLEVTLEKEITGYAENEKGNFYLISSPVDESIYSSDVENLLEENYEFYRFVNSMDLEWRHYNLTSFYLSPGNGYLYGNEGDQTLRMTGPTWASLENQLYLQLTYNDANHDYDGWTLVGNPFTCNGYLVFVDNDDDIANANFYRMNAAGNGYDIYEDVVELAPGEGAFVEYSESGYLYLLSYNPFGEEITPSGSTTLIPLLPKHGLGDKNPDASLILEDAGTDNSTILADLNGAKAPVAINGRTLYRDTKWNTICLPFDVTLEGSILEGSIVRPLADATVTDKHVSLTFGDAVTEIEAGVPYILKWEEAGEDIVNPSFGWVTINDAKPEAQDFADGNVSFVGYYDAFDITPEDNSDIWYLKSDNTLTHTAKPRTLKAFRTYLQLSEELSSGVNSFTIDFGDGETATGITEIADSSAPEGYYSLQGVKMEKAPKQKGVYIVNGKKVVVK